MVINSKEKQTKTLKSSSNKKYGALLSSKKNLSRRSAKLIRVGDICDLKITAVGPKGIGIDEFSYAFSILVPNTTLGDQIKAKIVQIPSSFQVQEGRSNHLFGKSRSNTSLNAKYAIAKVLEQAKKTPDLVQPPVNPGDLLDATITKLTPKGAGIVDISETYKLIVPHAKLGEKVQISVTRIKTNYGFAKIENHSNYLADSNQQLATFDHTGTTNHLSSSFSDSSLKYNKEAKHQYNLSDVKFASTIHQGSKLTIILPKSGKNFGKYIITKLQGAWDSPNKEAPDFVVFIKHGLGAKVGDKVRIKLTKVYSNFALAKIIQTHPISEIKKRSLIRNSIRQMVKNGMHFGEKAVKCNARMKNYVWLLKKKISQAPTTVQKNVLALKGQTGQILKKNDDLAGDNFWGAARHQYNNIGQPHIDKKNLVQANGTPFFTSQSFGLFSHHQQPNASKINIGRPLVKKGRHIINILKTRRCLNKALNQLSKYAAKGRTFLFIGTKKPAAGLIARASLFSKTSFFVNTRWLGGMLTNWKTILKSISKIRPILKEKQKIVRDILEKRQNIKSRLIKKALLLRKKSKLILNKGRQLIEQFKNEKTRTELLEKAQKLALKKKERLEKSQILLEKRQILIEKRREIMLQSQLLKNKGMEIASNYKALLLQLIVATKKLREFKSLLILSKEIQRIKTQANLQNKNIYSISYGFLKEYNKTGQKIGNCIVPNPPKDILNRIVITMLSRERENPLKQENNYLVGQKTKRSQPKSASLSTINTEQNDTNPKVIVLSKLLSKFSRFAPYIKSIIKALQNKIKEYETLCHSQFSILKNIRTTLTNYIDLKNKLISEFKNIQVKLLAERNIIRILKRKLQFFASQKRLIKFLPRLRYLPTPQNKISETVQILMKKIVDPKLKYPIDNIYDEKLSANSKKVAAARKKKWQRLEKYFGGIANMTKMNKTQIYKNVAIIIGQKEEMNAVRECKKLGIKMFNIVDTNCNPTMADHIIPANDDSRNSIKYILNKFLIRIRLAQKLRIRLSRANAHKFTLDKRIQKNQKK